MKTVFLDFDTVSHGDVDTGPLEATGIDLEVHGVTGDDDLADRPIGGGDPGIEEVPVGTGELEVFFRGEGDGPRTAPLQPALAELHERIHRAFDPAGLFSAPGEEQ